MTISKWVSSCFIGVCVIEICNSGSLISSATPESNDYDTQDHQRAFVPDIVLKSSPLRVNRGSGEVIRSQQLSGITRTVHQKKKSTLTTTNLLTTDLPPSPEELNQENGMNSADEDEKLSDDQIKEEEVLPTFSSTEIPKRKLAGSVRPFRSQQDLVESLKRRRQMMVQQQEYTSLPTTLSGTSSERTQSRSAISKRKYGNTKTSPSYVSTSNTSFEKKPRSSFNRRHGTQSTPLIVDEVVTEEGNIIPQPVVKGGRMKPNTWRTRN